MAAMKGALHCTEIALPFKRQLCFATNRAQSRVDKRASGCGERVVPRKPMASVPEGRDWQMMSTIVCIMRHSRVIQGAAEKPTNSRYQPRLQHSQIECGKLVLAGMLLKVVLCAGGCLWLY